MAANRRSLVIVRVVKSAERTITAAVIGVASRIGAAALIKAAVGAPVAYAMIRVRPLLIIESVSTGRITERTITGTGACRCR